MTVISILVVDLINKAEPTVLYKINKNVHIKTSKIINYIAIIIVFLTHHTIPHLYTNTHPPTHTHRRNATRGEGG